jgi:hypothetical protein
MEKFYAYLMFAYHVLQSGGKNKDDDFSKCGFVRVNNDNLIPYTVLNENEKGVPLFYFEGQIDILKEKASVSLPIILFIFIQTLCENFKLDASTSTFNFFRNYVLTRYRKSGVRGQRIIGVSNVINIFFGFFPVAFEWLGTGVSENLLQSPRGAKRPHRR